MSDTRIRSDGSITVGVDVENTGGCAGDEVVQLYIHDLAASVTRPIKELKGFQRVSLRAGENRRVEFTLGPRELGFYDRAMHFAVEPGRFKVMVGTGSEEGLESSFEVVPK
jgi:beta-glucosidase